VRLQRSVEPLKGGTLGNLGDLDLVIEDKFGDYHVRCNVQSSILGYL
jgi:hypothetical protein